MLDLPQRRLWPDGRDASLLACFSSGLHWIRINARGAMECPVCRANENGTWRRYSEIGGPEQNLPAEDQDQGHRQELDPMGQQQNLQHPPYPWPNNLLRFHVIEHYIYEVNPHSSTGPHTQGEQDPLMPSYGTGPSVPTDSPIDPHGNGPSVQADAPLPYGLCDDCINRHRSSMGAHSALSNGVSVPAGNLTNSSGEINDIPIQHIINPGLNDMGMPATCTDYRGIIFVHHYHVPHPYPPQQDAPSVSDDQVAPESQDQAE